MLPGAEYFYPHLADVHPVMDVLEAADLVVCAAGYGAVAEIAAVGRRAVLWPLDRARDDQAARTAGYPTFDSLMSAAGLAALMREALADDTTPPRAQAASGRGAEAVAEALAGVLAGA